MKSYPSYDALAVDLDLHFFDKISILSQIGDRLKDGSWLVITDDGHFHLFDKDGNLDDINKITVLQEVLIRKDIKKVIIPDSVTSIGWSAFRYCDSLTSVMIPNNVTIIKDFAFDSCSSLMSVTIPNSVTNIEYGVFYNCSSLTNMTIPKSIRYVGYNAFYNCKNLKNLFFKGKTIEQVKAMHGYPWGIEDESIIRVS